MRLHTRRRARPRCLRPACGGRRLLRPGGESRGRRVRLSRVRRRRAARRGHGRLPCENGADRPLHVLRRRGRARRGRGAHRLRRCRGCVPARDPPRWGSLPPTPALPTGDTGHRGRLPARGDRRCAKRPAADRHGRVDRACARRRRRAGKARSLPAALVAAGRIRPFARRDRHRGRAHRDRRPRSGHDAPARPHAGQTEHERVVLSRFGSGRGGGGRCGDDPDRALAWSWRRSKQRDGRSRGALPGR